MAVYDLNNPKHFEYDFNDILNRINQIYKIDNNNGVLSAIPIIIDNSGAYWASDENTDVFNKHVPTFKSLHKDMYACIETLSRQLSNDFKIEAYEAQYPDFKEFRLLNNTFKHNNNKNVEITLTKVVLMGINNFDLLCNFKYTNEPFKYLMYSTFIILFLNILKDLGVIQLT